MRLSYGVYKILQKYVHADYAMQKAVLMEAFDAHKISRQQLLGRNERSMVLELACGDGSLAQAFDCAEYHGLDLSRERICMAEKLHNGYQFDCVDVCSLDVIPVLKKADFVFCHATVHHLDDAQFVELLGRVRLYTRKPATMVMLEPVLDPWWLNPVGYILAKMDDGHYIRTSSQYRRLIGDVDYVKQMSFFPRWPCHMEAYIKIFN